MFCTDNLGINGAYRNSLWPTFTAIVGTEGVNDFFSGLGCFQRIPGISVSFKRVDLKVGWIYSANSCEISDRKR